MTRTNPSLAVRTALALAGCCLLALGCSKSTTTSGPSGGGGGDSAAKPSKANFEKVKDGMSEKEVTDIMGAPSASAEFDSNAAKDMLKGVSIPAAPALPGTPGLPALPALKLTVKNWEEGETLYEVVFQEGKVVAKGSESKKAKVTKENADKIKVGMSRAEVEAILGKGTTSAGAKIENFGGEVTVWEGPDGTITVGFANDKVTATGGWHKK